MKSIVSFFAFLLLVSCNEEITVGSSLLEDGTIAVVNDTLDITARTVLSDSIVSFRNSSNFLGQTYLIGEVDDPVFGKSRSELYFSTRIVDMLFPAFDTLKIDSVVLVIPLDTLGQIGNDNTIHNINVYQLEEALSLEPGDTIFTNQKFDYGMNPVSSVSLRINSRDSLVVYSPREDTLIKVPPQLRVPLDTLLWHDIAHDSLVIRDIDNFLQTVKGFALESTPSENSIVGLNLSSAAASSIQLYYSATTNDTTHSVYFFDIASVRSNNFIHDYSGSLVEQAINNNETDLFYLQSMQGVNIELDLSNIKNISNKIINRVSAVFYLVDESDPLYPPIQNLDVLYKNEDGKMEKIFDSLFEQGTAIELFGGQLESLILNGNLVYRYELDISNHAIKIKNGEIDNPIISVQAFNKAQRSNRSIIFGTSHPDFPAHVNVVLSNP